MPGAPFSNVELLQPKSKINRDYGSELHITPYSTLRAGGAGQPVSLPRCGHELRHGGDGFAFQQVDEGAEGVESGTHGAESGLIRT